MNERIRATRVIASRRIFEAIITPGYYVVLSVGLVLSWVLVTTFPAIVDTSGLNYSLHPLYDLIGRTLEGGFGSPFIAKLFAEGPFVLTLYVALLPVFLFLAINSIFRFTLERGVGAVELVVYGPADGTSYFVATFLKDVLLSLVTIVVVIVFFVLAAVANNLYVGPMVLQSAIIIIPVMMAGFAYAILSAVLTDNAAASIGIFLAINVIFVLVLSGSYTVVEGYARNLANVLSWILGWISPLYYWSFGLRSISYDSVSLFLLAIAALVALSVGLLYVSDRVLRKRGVRP